MRSWSAIEETVGEHFYDWSIGEIVNGQQLIEAGATDNPSDPQARGISARCSAIGEASDRLSGPAPHALYFAYQPTETPNEFNGIEACYDAAGNMVALFRVNLTACTDVDPLDETTVSWNCTESVAWSLSLTWDSVGRLVDIYKTDPSEGNTHIQNVYDSGNSRVIRLDHESSEGDERATLYLSGGYEIRNATINPDGTYFGGDETKFVFADGTRIARIVEPNSRGLTWPFAPNEGYVFFTLTNHLGSAAVTINAQTGVGSAAVVIAQTQLPYGNEDDAVESSTYGSWRPDYEFTGKERDPDVDLMYFGARFYAPGLARWVSADPLSVHGLGADLNQYRYVKNSPLILVDPNGLKTTKTAPVNQNTPAMTGQPAPAEGGSVAGSNTDPQCVTDHNRLSKQLEASGDSKTQLPPPRPPKTQEPASATTHERVNAGVKGYAEGLQNGGAQGAILQATKAIKQSIERHYGRDSSKLQSDVREYLGRCVYPKLRQLDRDNAGGKTIGTAKMALADALSGGATTLNRTSQGAKATIAANRANQSTKVLDLPGCFVAGTIVWTIDGPIRIEEIEVGDLVLSMNEQTKELSHQPVVETMRKTDREIGALVLLNESGEEETLGVTPGHPFWVKSEGWVFAVDLSVGDVLLSPREGWLKVSSGTWLKGKRTVFNLHVTKNHNYFVGKNKAFVHNGSNDLGGVQWRHSRTIRFTQNSINNEFSDGRSLREAIDGLRNGTISPEDFPVINVFQRNGQLFTLDNRRLYVFQQARQRIQYRVVDPDDPDIAAEIAKKFTTRNGGISVRVRGE